jgi:hypothetical protein
MVAGKRSPAAIRAMHAWRETNDQEARARITKWRYRPAVVVGVSLTDRIKKVRQARAISTVFIEYGGVQT